MDLKHRRIMVPADDKQHFIIVYSHSIRVADERA